MFHNDKVRPVAFEQSGKVARHQRKRQDKTRIRIKKMSKLLPRVKIEHRPELNTAPLAFDIVVLVDSCIDTMVDVNNWLEQSS